MRRTLGPLLLALVLGGFACQAKPAGHPSNQRSPEQHTRRDLELSEEEQGYLKELAAAADAAPEDFELRKRSGLAHMNFTLAGVTRLQERAELDLEAAFALDSGDRVLNRSLGRFYNMRAVAGDYSKAEIQVEVYAALLGEREPEQMNNEDFVAYSFFMLGAILTAKNRGRNLEALAKVKQLEQQLAARVADEPNNIELHALAGNFAFFFAGNIPIERERRVREAVAYFEVLRTRWEELRAGARHPSHCPNTRENFMFELAEGLLVLGRVDEARPIYAELTQIGTPRTRAKELIAHVAAERLDNADNYSGDMRLMPPWPSDVSNCVVCHAWSSEVGFESLYSLEPLRSEEVPSRAARKPLASAASVDHPGERGEIEHAEQLPTELAELIETRCAPCHFAGGEAVGLLDLSEPAQIEGGAAQILARVESGEMPPEQPLSAEERSQLRRWLEVSAEER